MVVAMKKVQPNKNEEVMQIRDLRIFPACWLPFEVFDLGLSWRAILVYSALAYYISGGTSCRPRLRILADLVGVSVDTARRGLKELEGQKAIRIERHFKEATMHREKGKREQLPNEYSLLALGKKRNLPI